MFKLKNKIYLLGSLVISGIVISSTLSCVEENQKYVAQKIKSDPNKTKEGDGDDKEKPTSTDNSSQGSTDTTDNNKDKITYKNLINVDIKIEKLKEYAEEARNWNINNGATKNFSKTMIKGQKLLGDEKFSWIEINNDELVKNNDDPKIYKNSSLDDFDLSEHLLIGVKSNSLRNLFQTKYQTVGKDDVYLFQLLTNGINFNYEKIEDAIKKLVLDSTKFSSIFKDLFNKKIFDQKQKVINFKSHSFYYNLHQTEKEIIDDFAEIINSTRSINDSYNYDDIKANLKKIFDIALKDSQQDFKNILANIFNNFLDDISITTKDDPGYYRYSYINKINDVIYASGGFSQNKVNVFDSKHKNFKNPLIWSIARTYVDLIENEKITPFVSTRKKLLKLNRGGNLISIIYETLLSKFKLILPEDISNNKERNTFEYIEKILEKDNFRKTINNIITQLHILEKIKDSKNELLAKDDVIKISQYETNASFMKRFLNHASIGNVKIGKLLKFQEDIIYHDFDTKALLDNIKIKTDLREIKDTIKSSNLTLYLSTDVKKDIKVKKNTKIEEIALIKALIKNKDDKIYLPNGIDSTNENKVKEAIKDIFIKRHGLLENQLNKITITADISNQNALKANFTINIDGTKEILNDVVVEKHATNLIKIQTFKNDFKHIFNFSLNNIISVLIESIFPKLDRWENLSNNRILDLLPALINDVEAIEKDQNIKKSISFNFTKANKSLYKINSTVQYKGFSTKLKSLKKFMTLFANSDFPIASTWKLVKSQVKEIEVFLSENDKLKMQNKTLIDLMLSKVIDKKMTKEPFTITQILKWVFIGTDDKYDEEVAYHISKPSTWLKNVKTRAIVNGFPTSIIETISKGLQDSIGPVLSLFTANNEITQNDLMMPKRINNILVKNFLLELKLLFAIGSYFSDDIPKANEIEIMISTFLKSISQYTSTFEFFTKFIANSYRAI